MNVLLLETVSEEAYEFLKSKVNVHLAKDPFSGSLITSQIPIDAIVTRGKGDVNQTLIDSCLPSLKVIARCGVGLDNINVAHASANKIPVINVPGSNADTVAEHAMSLILMMQRRLFQSIAAVKANNWAYRKQYAGDEVRNKMLGIIGMGNIGQKLANLASNFKMDVCYWDLEDKCLEFSKCEWNELLEISDIISLHLPLTEKTENLINSTNIQRMKNGVIIINTARGGLINMVDLIEGLQANKVGGFAADVLAIEPPDSDNPLLNMDNVLITPHSASLTKRTYNEMCLNSCRNAFNIMQGISIDQKYIFNHSVL